MATSYFPCVSLSDSSFSFFGGQVVVKASLFTPLKELKYWKSWKRRKKRKAKVKFHLCYLEDRAFCLVGVLILWRGRTTLRKLSFGSLKVKVSNFQKVGREPSWSQRTIKISSFYMEIYRIHGWFGLILSLLEMYKWQYLILLSLVVGVVLFQVCLT